LREGAVQVLGEPHVREGGRLMDDRVGRGPEDGQAHGVRVEQIERDRLCPECAKPFRFVG
jgi:hypothetical protein